MSGDVQPRKRKDKKRKKDELGVEEHRGTAAALGEGDVFMHSHHDHGTGGHWCAKIIFFSLLAVLITLIGLIILENRGLTELEANSVESRYSGVLNGWLEDAPDDDHHDEHTLELLKHHDIENDHEQTHDISQEDQDEIYPEENESGEDHDDEDDNDQPFRTSDQDISDEDEKQDDEQDNSYEEQDDNDDEEESDGDNEHIDSNENEQDDDNSEELQYEESDEAYNQAPSFEKNESDEEKDDDDIQDIDEGNSDEDELAYNQSIENDGENSRESANNDEEDDEHEEEDADSEIEVEKLETEASDEDAVSAEQLTKKAADDDNSQELSLEDVGGANDDDDDSVEDVEFLEDIDEPLPVVEHITVPKGKPLAEMEDEEVFYKPADTLVDEEEYEKQQEELRRDEAQASHVWLKLAVGGALLVATYAVVSRVIAPRDVTSDSENLVSSEATPSMTDRRMTLILQEVPTTVTPKKVKEIVVTPKVEKKTSFGIKSVPPISKEESDEEGDIKMESKDVSQATSAFDLETEDKELFSDDEDEEDEFMYQKEKTPKPAISFIGNLIEPEHVDRDVDEDVPDDVEIIDDERLEEEMEEEEDEDDISDVDDAELLTRLEAKYGRLPEPDRGYKHKDGGNSIEDDWPGEPSDKYWREQLDEAENKLRQGSWSAAISRVSAMELRGSGRARWLLAQAMDAQAEAQRDNRLLSRAIAAYLDLLKLNEHISDVRLREVTSRTLDRIKFRGNYQSAEPVYRLLIRRFPDVVEYRNNLTVSFLMANRADLAEEVTRETLQKWPDDRLALAHIGFILKTQHNRLEEAVEAFQKALEGDVGPATEPRFYYHLGDSLLLLNRFAEAHEVHQRGAKLGHFLSPNQRSLYNVERLKSRPWWNIEQTPYLSLARALEKSWKDILKEGQAAQALYEKEKEGLKERGEWSQLDIFVRGQEVPGRCKKAPVTCSIVRTEKAASGCRRGQVKFSAMESGTHVRPHVGPTNCRLRMHLGLSNTKDTYIRVDQETRQWQAGKVFIFDDSFEHEVWHNGTDTRLVLIVDVWHPELTADERRQLAPI